MNTFFNTEIAANYKSQSQKIRVMSEKWTAENIFCPNCGHAHITKLTNNKPVADFRCEACGEIYELKSKEGKVGKKIVDGAYATMLERITSLSNPNLFVMDYSRELEIIDFVVIPKFFFVPGIIEKRKALAPTARRAGWIGCNILFDQIPTQGIIKMVDQSQILNSDLVVASYDKIKAFRVNNLESRGWIMDVLTCVNAIPTQEFTLADVYGYSDKLQLKHRDNHNIEAKIRQQLQLLRDKGFIEFCERGKYRKKM